MVGACLFVLLELDDAPEIWTEMVPCRLANYTPGATVVRLLTTNVMIAYVASWVLFLSGASEDHRMLLPAWISITTVRTMSSRHAPLE